jgi:hypothetical protein
MHSTIAPDPLHAPRRCAHCGAIAIPRVGPGNGPHAFRATCQDCGEFIQWLSQYAPTEREARRQAARQDAMARQPPSAAQLRYLKVLGDSAPPPTSMAEASTHIDLLRRQRRGQ